jgi:hypothetical protein
LRLIDLVEDTPETRVAGRAWDLARKRHRRRVAVAAAASTGAVVCTVLIATTAFPTQLDAGPDTQTPSQSSSTTPRPSDASSTSPQPPLIDNSVVGPTLGRDDFERMASEVPTLAPAGITELSADPVERAVLAMTPNGTSGAARYTTVLVLGSDGNWRQVDAPGLVPTHDKGGYEGHVLAPTSLDPTATKLALVQPGEVVLADLTTGKYTTYAVPGANIAAMWEDDQHLLVTTEGSGGGATLDLATGAVTSSDRGDNTTFLPDGSWLSWSGFGDSRVEHSQDTVLTSSDGSYVITRANNQQGLAPLANNDVVVGCAGLTLNLGLDTRGYSGLVAVDRHSGAVLGFQPTLDDAYYNYVLGFDGDSVLAALVQPQSVDRLLVRWTWSTRELKPFAIIPGEVVSWAGPADDLPG